jgi:hypothetical protein
VPHHEGTPSAPERILVYIRPAAATLWNVADLSGSTQLLALAQRAPWRSILIAVVVVVVSSMSGSDLLLGWGLIASLGLGGLELWHRQDILTTTRLVRQYGIFGRRRKELLLRDIQRVEFSYPRFGKYFHAGDVDVVGIGRAFTFVGVHEPEALAQAILDARQAVLETPASDAA